MRIKEDTSLGHNLPDHGHDFVKQVRGHGASCYYIVLSLIQMVEV
jgi:hypothetical protein